MASFQRFEDIDAWQEGRALTQAVYSITKEGPFSRDYALRDQLRRAAISITSNIAEGHERNSHKAFLHFLSIAKGSAGEVRSQLYVALDESYINQDEFDHLYERASRTIRIISGLMSYLSGYK